MAITPFMQPTKPIDLMRFLEDMLDTHEYPNGLAFAEEAERQLQNITGLGRLTHRDRVAIGTEAAMLFNRRQQAGAL